MKHIALAGALVTATAASHAATLISEGFESFAALAAAGWLLVNQSTPIGTTSITTGDATIFEAQAGSPESYLSANYNNAAAGGTIDSRVITPAFSTAQAGSVSFWLRADIAPGFFDSVTYGFTNAAGAIPAGTVLPLPTVVAGTWTQYTVPFAAQGAGSSARFAIIYTGLADNSNYLGIDSVVVTSVPEPSTWLMLGAGLFGLVAARRRAVAAR